jgi:hypothetical protein
MEKNFIPLSDITDEARNIAVAWVENYEPMGFDIEQKHKLASDIMNYSNQQLAEYKAKLKRHLRTSGKWRWSTGELTDLIDSIT